ncbi:hypothetical protein GCK72_026142 [Caenorhabditis remanei]|uniref:Uncharacterized protein n=1 Tax=Caenorhabditis remanei TaxID=31234 RepID=A0A6A5G516_CAERE|nr:hypothetical protein GCK72_026142 [Caenorhabditis remanei]KAF1749674.1 hypothetical protein GCK72_026142 [Caenorhabditis remanei]
MTSATNSTLTKMVANSKYILCFWMFLFIAALVIVVFGICPLISSCYLYCKKRKEQGYTCLVDPNTGNQCYHRTHMSARGLFADDEFEEETIV